MTVRTYSNTISVAVLILGISLSACDQTDLSDGGVYAYTASDSLGVMLVTGTLEVKFGEDADASGDVAISGTWQLQQSGNGAQVGPQTGSGNLEGSVDGQGSLWINLNPDWADNNVFLAGGFSGERFADFEGTWSYSTFVGPVAGGNFKATRE
jgi:hypothetical protein